MLLAVLVVGVLGLILLASAPSSISCKEKYKGKVSP